jgi:quercetin dioxygenase-like cupin family protein
LAAEGFAHTYVWQDGPNAFYSDHTHIGLTAHIILDGEMTLTMDGTPQTFHAGDRCDIPAGAVHSAQMGSKGCRYLVGER